MKKSLIAGLIALSVVWVGGILYFPPSTPVQERNVLFSEETDSILRRSCFDCHSNETVRPWYSWLPVASIFLGYHIRDGRKHLNFSVWESYTEKRKKRKMKEIIELTEEKEMPLTSYLWLHKDAALSADDIALLKKALEKGAGTAEKDQSSM